MRSFKDNRDRTWTIALNVWEVKRIRSILGIDLANVITLDKDGKVQVDLIDRIANDPCLLVDILWVLVGSEAKERGVADVDFGSALAGDAITEATRAFLDELVDFFPGAKRLFLAKAVDLARKFDGEMTEALAKALEDPAFERRIRESMNSSPSSPGSSV